MTDSLTGRVLDGTWELEGRVATGSFASVYRAVNRVEGGYYAVKILTELTTPEAEARFRAEFATLRRVAHPHIVRGYAVGTVDGCPYMVLDYVPGGNVHTLLEESGPLDPGTAARLAIQVLSALAEAHARGIIHRDVKPGNVLVDAAGDARLCDFGVARIAGGRARLTMHGTSVGTLLYMAPEQRVDSRTVDLTADLYGVACLLYRLVLDESPADLFAEPLDSPRWQAVPEPLRSVLHKATRLLPRDRYRDAREMALALLPLVPADRRPMLVRTCDPAAFPDPDPLVRARGQAPAEPSPAPPNTVVPAQAAADALAGRPAAEGSPWPWRLGVAAFVVVVLLVATLFR